MNEQKMTITEIQEWIEAVTDEVEPFSDTKALTILKQVDKQLKDNQEPEDIKLLEEIKVQLYVSLMEFRFKKVHQFDQLMKKWLEQALHVDKQHPQLTKWHVEYLFTKLQEINVPFDFPAIRETDHSSTKKERAEQYYYLAEQYFEQLDGLKAIYEEIGGIDSNYDVDLRIEKILQLYKWYQKMQEPFSLIIKATGAYAQSISGIYYSNEQLQQIKKAVTDIKEVISNWQELLDELKADQKSQSALVELQEMIGLDMIKTRVEKLYQYLQYQKRRAELGYTTKDGLSLHMIFTGNPGTGKTTMARLIAKIYHELGLLEHNQVYEVDRSQLVGGFVGQTEELTMQAIEKATGGVLFIDEAYSLKRAGASGNDYGQTVIDTLVAAMTGEKANQFAVILAGYPEEMNTFLRSNPGLRSRFPEQNQLEMKDYSTSALLEIGKKIAADNDFLLTEQAEKALIERIEKAQVDESFGNARTVKNIILDAIFEKGSKASNSSDPSQFVLLQEQDVLPETEDEMNAQAELEQLIGLEQVKAELKKLSDYIKIQQMRRKANLKTSPIQLHTIFSGASGTGKTTVAKIYARILKELGILKRGHLVVASRADLVAGYIGQTATKTKEKVRDALGGVLFIDEAYSLFSPNKNDFGQEAITTLLQEMSHHQENIVVVLAGYEKEMQEFINSNPGLNSRFQKQVNFPSYSNEELVQIIFHKIKSLGYNLTEEAVTLIEKSLPEKGHAGNGRFAHNFVEELIQGQAERLIKNQLFDTEDLSRITRVDVEQLIKS
ncbi:AAA family ATPase [Alkalihalobacillus pseudalcaliphilus]|uniref:AAA family ATPase n=1 Tax=Alkalihalobacillus pseudalcaliphilus TaxID=79884 RepID=UPI00235E327A|nr:AAA family ATPase [Alkalihalobacillus pseudalcaliphilus]